jgi:hypothetical protein
MPGTGYFSVKWHYFIIDRAEGPTHLCGRPVIVKDPMKILPELSKISDTAPKTGGYDKVDIVCVRYPTFDDPGEVRRLRADIKHHSIESPTVEFGYIQRQIEE